MKILLAITFVYGVLCFLTGTKLFKDGAILSCFFQSIGIERKSTNSLLLGFIIALDTWFYYFSLVFQSWYWLFK